jgi:hypothetical protein
LVTPARLLCGNKSISSALFQTPQKPPTVALRGSLPRPPQSGYADRLPLAPTFAQSLGCFKGDCMGKSRFYRQFYSNVASR